MFNICELNSNINSNIYTISSSHLLCKYLQWLYGLVLGKRLGFISQIIYVLLGTIGLPVFAQFSGGIGIILGPTGGFILSFPIIAFIVGYFSEKFKSTIGIMFGMICSLLISYIIGNASILYMTNSDFKRFYNMCSTIYNCRYYKLSLAT